MATSNRNTAKLSFTQLFQQVLCAHKHLIRRTAGTRLFVQCSECGFESRGIETGGFAYNRAVTQNNRTWIYNEKPSGRAIFSLEIGQ